MSCSHGIVLKPTCLFQVFGEYLQFNVMGCVCVLLLSQFIKALQVEEGVLLLFAGTLLAGGAET